MSLQRQSHVVISQILVKARSRNKQIATLMPMLFCASCSTIDRPLLQSKPIQLKALFAAASVQGIGIAPNQAPYVLTSSALCLTGAHFRYPTLKADTPSGSDAVNHTCPVVGIPIEFLMFQVVLPA